MSKIAPLIDLLLQVGISNSKSNIGKYLYSTAYFHEFLHLDSLMHFKRKVIHFTFQVTVRSSPVVPETLTVCKQCHRTCLTNQNGASIFASNNNSERTFTSNNNPNSNLNKTTRNHSEHVLNEDDWRPLVLMGLNAVNPAVSLLKFDPFSAPLPKISVLPPTPDCARKSDYHNEETANNINCNCKGVISVSNFVLPY